MYSITSSERETLLMLVERSTLKLPVATTFESCRCSEVILCCYRGHCCVPSSHPSHLQISIVGHFFEPHGDVATFTQISSDSSASEFFTKSYTR